MINENTQLQSKLNISIGNGLGSHKYVKDRSYTLRFLIKCGLTNQQIYNYFIVKGLTNNERKKINDK
ncbi:hypothetical protein DIDNDMLP_00246 [Klebsiella phage KP13-7]|nr:hypothetical protein DIDNDMLP_00246 [Klebsiella phage KP13-7]